VQFNVKPNRHFSAFNTRLCKNVALGAPRKPPFVPQKAVFQTRKATFVRAFFGQFSTDPLQSAKPAFLRLWFLLALASSTVPTVFTGSDPSGLISPISWLRVHSRRLFVAN